MMYIIEYEDIDEMEDGVGVDENGPFMMKNGDKVYFAETDNEYY